MYDALIVALSSYILSMKVSREDILQTSPCESLSNTIIILYQILLSE